MRGFTLIEILVSLVILSIALTAIIQSTTQNTKNTLYLQDKMLASWVASQIISEARVGLLTLPEEPGLEQETTLLNQQWPWQAYSKFSANAHLQELHVIVYKPKSHIPLIHNMSYRYAI